MGSKKEPGATGLFNLPLLAKHIRLAAVAPVANPLCSFAIPLTGACFSRERELGPVGLWQTRGGNKAGVRCRF